MLGNIQKETNAVDISLDYFSGLHLTYIYTMFEYPYLNHSFTIFAIAGMF